MRVKQLRDMNDQALEKREQELEQELFNLRFQLHTGHLENTARLSQVRKDIARVKTIRAQRGQA